MSITLGPIFNTQSNKIREWSITLTLFNASDKQVLIKGDPQAFAVKEGYYVSYSTCSGYTGMKMTTSANTIVNTGKNLGRRNETNVLTQALKECQSKYAAKIKAGYTETTNVPNVATSKANPNKSAVPFPMAVKTWKDHKAKLSFPLFVQPKLDGIRMIAHFVDGEVVLYTRRLHDITGFAKVKADLKKMFIASGNTSFFIDGELYSHGMNLQTISGLVRNESIDDSEKEALQYYVFDCFDVAQPKIPFNDRIGTLTAFVDSAKSNMIVLNETIHVASADEADAFYNRVIGNGYEGIIYKSASRPYEFDFNKEKRSSWYLKRKKQEDAEFAIVGYTQGKGKDVGCIVFQLQGPNKKTFNCVPNGTYDYRKQLFEEATKSFDTSFKNKLAKVLYDDLSKDGVPLRGRIIQIGRDLSFD